MHCCRSLAVNRLVARGHLLRVVAIVSTIYTFRSVICGHVVFVIASVINKVHCPMAQPCQRCFLQWQHKNLWQMHLLQWRLQRDQFHCRHCGALFQWWGIAIDTINFTESALASSQALKVMAQLFFVVKGLLLPCTAYVALMQLIVTWRNVRGQLPLWQGAQCHLPWWMRPPWGACHTRPWQRTCCLWRAYLWQSTRHL